MYLLYYSNLYVQIMYHYVVFKCFVVYNNNIKSNCTVSYKLLFGTSFYRNKQSFFKLHIFVRNEVIHLRTWCTSIILVVCI